ncbi:MAG TPA: DUF4336 domain-containing protein [Rhodanobacteraceae bacterium]|nr:DUF4336 domain-containing protein [Rhodanobacteraceae bacterium]
MDRTLQIADALWIVDGPIVRWLTMPFPTRMTIARLDDGSLFIHSPIPPTDDIRAFVASLGTPRYIVSPNKLHHLFMQPWREVYAGVRTYAPPGLRAKRPDLVFDGDLSDAPEPSWRDEIDQLRFAGSRALDEIVFFHKPSRTAIFGDLIENFDAQTLSTFHRFVARIGGVLAPHGATPRDLRQSFRGRHDQARESLQRVLDWQPRAAIMCHGIPVLDGATPFIASAFSWLSADT